MMILKMWIFKAMFEIICLIYLKIQGQFVAFIIIDTIVIVFYKATFNTSLMFNRVITEFLNSFYAAILEFLFVMINCGISKYQSENKVVRSFDRKIVQKKYCHI